MIRPYTGAAALYVSPHRKLMERLEQQVYLIGKPIKPNASFSLSDEAIRIKVKEREELRVMEKWGAFRGKECLCEPCKHAAKYACVCRNEDDDECDSTGSDFEEE